MNLRQSRVRVEARRLDPVPDADPLRWVVIAVLVATAVAVATSASI